MSPETLAGIVARDAESIVWAPGTLASDPAVNDKLWQAVQDRRALLVLIRETREALEAAREPIVEPVGPTTRKWWRLGWLSCHAVVRDPLATLGPP